MNPSEPLLPAIDPPVGGLDGLRGRLRMRQLRLGMASAVLMLSLGLGWIGTTDRPSEWGSVVEGAHPLKRLVSTHPVPALRVVGGTAAQWPSSSSRTRIYLVDTLD